MPRDDSKAKIYETVATTLDETKHHQIDSWDRLDTKATQIISADLVLAGLSITGATTVQSVHFRAFVLATIALLTASVLACSRTLIPGSVAYGLGEGASRRAEQLDDVETLYYDLMRATESAIAHNKSETEAKSRWLGIGIWAAAVSLVFLLAAIVTLSLPTPYAVVWDGVAVLVISLVAVAYYFYTKAKQK
jgi:multidrug transporter EmrE-like cation transporter